jgi:choline dehydrogenase-like flavoprotein
VSGRWRAHPFEEPRSSDFPLAPLPEDPIASRIDLAAQRLGMHAFPTPRAILSAPRGSRSSCKQCALCANYACAYGAKSSMDVSLLPDAVATGRCEIRTGCMATELELAADGRVSGVVYRDDRGVRRRITARCVVLACTAVETARLLLLSTSSRFPSGLGNRNGLVGKNLVFSSTGIGRARFGHPRGEPISTRPFVQRSIQDYYLLDEPVDGVRKGGTLLFDWDHPNPIGTAERLSRDRDGLVFGKRLKDSLRRNAAGAHTLRFEVFGEYLPTSGTYVDLDPSVTDRWGVPVARMTEARHPLDLAATSMLVARGMSVLGGLGADETHVESTTGVTRFLQGGTCRFGDDPATSVLDRDCRLHEVPNLYVTDGSFLPNAGSVPVTLTILANSFRVADRIAARFA